MQTVTPIAIMPHTVPKGHSYSQVGTVQHPSGVSVWGLVGHFLLYRKLNRQLKVNQFSYMHFAQLLLLKIWLIAIFTILQCIFNFCYRILVCIQLSLLIIDIFIFFHAFHCILKLEFTFHNSIFQIMYFTTDTMTITPFCRRCCPRICLKILCPGVLTFLFLFWFDLTHWGRDEIDTNSQPTFSNAFSWKKMFEYRLKFHWNLFLRIQFRRQVIIWINDG